MFKIDQIFALFILISFQSVLFKQQRMKHLYKLYRTIIYFSVSSFKHLSEFNLPFSISSLT